MQPSHTDQKKNLFLVFAKDSSDIAWISATHIDEAKQMGIRHLGLNEDAGKQVAAMAIDCPALKQWVVSNHFAAMSVRQPLNMVVMDSGSEFSFELGASTQVHAMGGQYIQALNNAVEQNTWLALPQSEKLMLRASIRNEILMVTLGVISGHRQTSIPALSIVICLVEDDRELAWEYAATGKPDNRVDIFNKPLACPNAPFVAIKTGLGFAQSETTIDTYMEIAVSMAKIWWHAKKIDTTY